MSLRYDRTIKDGKFLNLLAEGGDLNFLISPGEIGDDRDAVDVQIREKDTITYYHGTTKLLKVAWRGDKLAWETAHLKSGVVDLDVLRDSRGTGGGLRGLFETLLRVALKSAPRKYYKDHEQTEGYWHNKMCRHFGGPAWKEDREWLVFDREAVLGFDRDDPKGPKAGQDKKEFYDECKKEYEDVRNKLQEEEKGWGKPGRKRFGDELDLIAVGRDHQLVCIELKHGSGPAGVYWGPLQAGVYREAWQTALQSEQGKDIIDGIEGLIEQKIDFKLLPEEAQGRLPVNRNLPVEGVLAVAAPKRKGKSLKKLEIVQQRSPRRVREVLIDEAMRLPPLREGTSVE